jgi:hypothetical protein
MNSRNTAKRKNGRNSRNTKAVRNSRRRKLELKDFSRCHPKVRGESCMPRGVYEKIAKQLQVSLHNVFKASGCGEGENHCLLDKSALDETEKKELRKQYLRPRYPKEWLKDPDMWLDNFNIEAVMKQYEEAYPWFKFMGVFPIDFSAPDPYTNKSKCLYNEICSLQLKAEYEKGVRGIGFIFNLDPHFKGGSHWVGLYIDINDIKNPFCAYFDSYGYKTPALIARLMRSFRIQIPTINLGFNARRFQYGGSECGMFSMYFLICMIHGIPFKEFCKDSVNDTFMLELRKILFSK